MKINFSINYKGYTADVSYEPEDKIYVGEVRGISDSLNFHGRSILEINTMFHQSIENYLDLCKQIGKDPERATDYKLACRIYTCISDNTDCMAEPEAVQPGEYYMITAGTAQYKNGLSFAELQSIFANLGCTYARSMDGGGSSSLVVNGKLLNTPAQYDERPVVDFLSFLP